MILVLITSPRTADTMSLTEAAERLGVHYMTAYRYVRLGQLPSSQRNGRWVIKRADVDALRRDLSSRDRPSGGAGRRRPSVLRERLARCLLRGDESGAWVVMERALTTGYTPAELYLQLLGPALRGVGDKWEDGDLSVGEEHRASAVAGRLLGRLGPRFVRPGRKHGTVVLGAAPGDPHGIPVAMLADIVRAHGYWVVDLGGNVPVPSFVEAASVAERVVAVGVSVSDGRCLPAAGEVIVEVQRRLGVPVLIGGPATDEQVAAELGADGSAPDGETAAALIDSLRQRPPAAPSASPEL
jgi:excisionase family DNA binding protein